MSTKNKVFSFLFFLCLISFFQLRNLNNQLTERHAWANADHYAIAIGFTNNNFDFFHPETYCLNPQFKASKGNKITYNDNNDFWDSNLKNPTGITAIDFPIHQYVVSLLMTVFKSTAPWVYRLYMLLISTIGLFFLFKSSYLINKSYLISSLLILFVYFSPTYNFYCFQFLPTAASLSFIFIAFYHYLKYLKTDLNKNWYFCLLFILIAGLARLPFVIYAMSLFGYYTLKSLIEKKIEWKKLSFLALLILSIASYFLYNKIYLANLYGSNFLNYPLYPETINHIISSIKGTIYYESWRYFTPIHYFIIVLITIKYIKRFDSNYLKSPIIIIYFLITGVSIYSFIMIRQFVAHDYYLLDTFFPLLIIIFITISNRLNINFSKHKKLMFSGILSTLLFLIIINKKGFLTRENNEITKTSNNFTNADKILDSLKIGINKKILLLDSYSPNEAFTEMKRKGFCVMTLNYETLKRALKWNFDYIITQNFTYKEKVLKSYPNFENETKLFFKNNNFSIYQLKKHEAGTKKN